MTSNSDTIPKLSSIRHGHSSSPTELRLFNIPALHLIPLPSTVLNVFNIKFLLGRGQQCPSGSSPIWTILCPARPAATEWHSTVWLQRAAADRFWCRSAPTPIHRISWSGTAAKLPSSATTATIHWIPSAKPAAFPEPASSATTFPDRTVFSAATYSAKDGSNVLPNSSVFLLNSCVAIPSV